MHSKGAHETRGARVGRTIQWGTETLGDLWKGEGLGRENGVYMMDITGTFCSSSDPMIHLTTCLSK